MSIVLVGSTSGSITLQEPAVSGSTVLTLPAVTGTILTTTSPKAGNVIQVVNVTYSTAQTTSSASLVDTGLTASITPTSSSNKILVFVHQSGVAAGTALNGVTLALLRSSTSIIQFGLYNTYGAADIITSASTAYLDSPATTSSTTYKTQFCRTSGAGAVFTQANGVTSTMTLMEIAA